MEAAENIIATPHARGGKLLKVLGVGFGLAISVGGTVGVGILRSPGPVAELLASPWLIMLAWTLGGIYCVFGANHLVELATMIPKSGGFYVFAERAFGRYGGFVIGWCDWLNNTLGTAFISVVFGEYAASLFAPNLAGGRVIFSVLVIVALTILNLLGVRAGSETQKLTSFLKAFALLAFVAACFVFGGQNSGSEAAQIVSAAPQTFTPVAFVLALQLVLGAYDGWYTPIYFSEEDTDPTNNLPRSIFGGIALVTLIYLLVNLGILYLLPMSKLAGSKFAGADAMSLIFGARSGQILTILALLSFIGIINAIMMATSRQMFALGREGFFTRKAAAVSRAGTPVFALLVTSLITIILTSVGTFELLLAIASFFALVIVIVMIVAFFTLRRLEPETPRPFRAKFYPFAPALMFVFAALLFIGYIVGNPFPSLYALAVLAVSYPVYRLIKN